MVKDNAKSVLQLEKMAFENIQFARDTASSAQNVDYNMEFTREVSAGEDGNHFLVKLTANLKSKESETIRIKITLVGYFICCCEDEALKMKLINYNSIAILFPYIRSQISLITAQPDLTPVVLPPVNIVAMFEETEAKESDNEE